MNPAKGICVSLLALGALLAAGSAEAQAEFVGRWVLDTASSTSPAGLPVPTAGTLEITDAGGGKFKSVTEATVNGAVGRAEVTFSVDGKDYETTSTPPPPPGAPSVTQAVERVGENVYKVTVKLNGQPMATALNELSSDGNTLTQTTTGLGQFAVLSSTTVFRRK